MSDTVRRFIRAVIKEVAITSDAASSGGMGLYIDNSSGEKSVVLYNTVTATDNLEKLVVKLSVNSDIDVWAEFQEAIEPAVIGVIKLVPNDGECYGAWQVASVAAEKGYGPLMYDVGFSISKNHTLTSDRKNVTPRARAMWDRMAISGGSAHSGVESMPLDDRDDPKTPPKEDDCQFHPGDPQNALNRAYRAKDPMDTTALEHNHQAFKKWVLTAFKANGIGARSVTNALTDAGMMFFSSEYWKAISA